MISRRWTGLGRVSFAFAMGKEHVEENTSKVYAGRIADPLLAAPQAGNGSSLFIINLCASIAPVQTAGKTIPGFENYRLYQVARVEDGRTRHRLRLGFFTSEADAEQVLAAVRDNYPTAFVTCLSDDDRRFARGYLPDTEATASWKRPVALVDKPAARTAAPVQKEAAKPAARPAAPAPAPKAAAPAVPAPATKPAAPATRSAPVAPPADASVIEVEWQPDTKAATAKPQAPASAAPADEIELSWEPPALQAPASAGNPASTVAPALKTEQVIKARPAPTPPPAASKPAGETKKAQTVSTPTELTLAKEAAPAPQAASAATNQPFHVGKGAQIPTTALSLEATGRHVAAAPAKPAAKTADKHSAPTAAEPARKTPVTAAPSKPAAPTPPASTPARAATPAAASADRRAVELDSTQTIRALTSAEMNDDEKWFSIQLVMSEQPVNLDALPHLDIFEAYRVYSVANAGSGKILYSLRLGFFREEVSANAVCGYLQTFFGSPSVLRISTAEQLRFKDAPMPKATAAAAKGEAKVIELNAGRKPPIPTVTMEVASPAADRSPTGTFKTSSSGSYKVNASGVHKALKPAAKTSPPATKRSAPLSKTSSTGKHKTLPSKKSLQEQLLDEAREVQLSESAIRKLPKNDSLLSRLVDKLTK